VRWSCLLFCFRLVEVIQRFVGILDGAEGTLDLALRAGRHALAILACGNVGQPVDAQGLHHVLEYATLGHRPIVEIDHLGPALKWKFGLVLRRHRIEQKAQRRFRVFAVNAAVFEKAHAASVIDHALQHQGRFAFARVDPGRRFDVFQVGRRHVELPAIVAVLRLKAHGGRLPAQARLIQVPAREVFVHRAARQHTLRRAHQAMPGLDAILFQQLDGALGGQVPPCLVGGPEFEGGDQLAVALQLRFRHQAWRAVIATMRRARLEEVLQRPIHGAGGDAVQFGARLHLCRSLPAFAGQAVQPLPQMQQRIGRDQLTPPDDIAVRLGQVVVQRRFGNANHLADFPDRVFVFMVEPQGQLITEFQCSWTLNNGKG